MNKPTTGKQAKSPEPTLPCNVDAERFVLGSLLLDSERHLPAVRSELQPADFSLEKHRRIFSGMADLHARGEKIDRVTLAHELMRLDPELKCVDGLTYLVSLDDGLPESPNIDSYITIVKRMSTLRRIIREAKSIGKQAMLREDPDLIMARVTKVFSEMLAATNGTKQEAAPTIPQWPEPLHEDAFYGVAGDLVHAISPESEADPAGLLLQVLVGFGNMAGRGPHIAVEGDRHHTNEYAVLVGISSIARKGTSWGRVRSALEAIDQHWVENCLLSGLGSGEAMIESLNDADHRRLVLEPEFARVLAVMSREGTTLSAAFRQCWDSGNADIKVRGKGEVHARGAHLSAICHVTKDELLRKLSGSELANGFANRYLFACVARSQELPFGGDSIQYGDSLNRLRRATDFARKLGSTRVQFDQEASGLWVEKYHDLTVGKPGLFGDLVARRAPHVLRLALNYALLDCADKIRIEHLRAALAVWRYCEQSALFVWGDALGDPTADELVRVLRTAGADGMTKWDITNHFGRNRPAAEIDRAVAVLAEHGLIRSTKEDSGGRPTVRYWAT